ncbi:MAG: hypothetical protein A2161_08650 [Candidatus Schekmanbacteria bacterium RBG_13_48_7]|uniref:DUF1565 domain-containing protein n=1 Tax=Candidatus Schekmanbacteria bacterium RBG_13_48_7 TaxID=1817878 RepID=A0A1F7RVW4_9BACT|nr:MAG: hypothetical protein A2161_08650 [Candidatus Schekmanbacteria bacterium RBG_13_48_7]
MKTIKEVLIIVNFMVLVAANVFAQTPTPTFTATPAIRYVSVSGGSNENGGTSWSDAWKTLTYACKNAPKYAYIYVSSGKYEYMKPSWDPEGVGEVFPLEPKEDGLKFIGTIGSDLTPIPDRFETIIDASKNAYEKTPTPDPSKTHCTYTPSPPEIKYCHVFEIVGKHDISIENFKITGGKA